MINKCKHVDEFLKKPIIELINILGKDFICSYCNKKVTIDDIINEVKEK